MHMRKTFIVATSLVMLSACSEIPLSAHFNRGSPESLLDVSSETVTVSLDSPSALSELTGWINNDQPTRADLYCTQSDPACYQAEQVLQQFGVPAVVTPAADNTVVLAYDRLQARDCENRYINNAINPYNLPHPTFGCSIAANMVQMVGDKRQFTNPSLLDFHDGDVAAQVYRGYLTPKSAIDEAANDANYQLKTVTR
jgi:hypothetical protein